MKFFIKIIVFFFLFNITIHAENIIKIDRISINAEGVDPNDAGSNALFIAKREAFIKLLKNLSIHSGFNDYITPEEIDKIIYSHQIKDEKIYNNNYEAKFRFSFLKDKFQKLLYDKNISSDSLKNEEYVIILNKILSTKEKIKEDFLITIEKEYEDLYNEFSDLLQYSYNGSDYGMFSILEDKELLFFNRDSSVFKYEKFPILSQKDPKIFLIISYHITEDKLNILVTKIRKFHKEETKFSFFLNKDFIWQEIIEEIFDYFIVQNTEENRSIQNAIKKSFSEYIYIPINNLSEWVAIKNALKEADFIKKINIISISRDLVKVEINFDTIDNLFYNFSRYNLLIELNKDGIWFLKLENDN